MNTTTTGYTKNMTVPRLHKEYDSPPAPARSAVPAGAVGVAAFPQLSCSPAMLIT